jgi:hypothetical protein
MKYETEKLGNVPPQELWSILWPKILWASHPAFNLKDGARIIPLDPTQTKLKREALDALPPLTHELVRRLQEHWENATFDPDNPAFQAIAAAFSTMGLPDGYY